MDIPIELQYTLSKIGDHCPAAMTTFLHCLNRADETGSVRFTKEQIENDISESYTKFRNNIKALAREDLLEWHKMPVDGISVTLADMSLGGLYMGLELDDDEV